MQNFILRHHLFKEIKYPLRYQRERLFKTVLVQFSVIFVFLLWFKPFGVYEPEHKTNYVLICSLHALSPALIIYAYFISLSYIHIKTSKPIFWTPLREYAHSAIIFLATGITSFFLRSVIYNNPDNWSWRYLWEEIRNCYLAGILFYFFLLFADSYFRADNSSDVYKQAFSEPSLSPAEVNSTTTALFIKTQVQQDDFSFDPAHLLFAKADGNYIELTVCSGQQVSTELKRISLKQFEGQLTNYPFLFRCHRAYLVNLHQIKKVSGNAQGYILSLDMTGESVPVSRTQLELFNIRYSQLSGVAFA